MDEAQNYDRFILNDMQNIVGAISQLYQNLTEAAVESLIKQAVSSLTEICYADQLDEDQIQDIIEGVIDYCNTPQNAEDVEMGEDGNDAAGHDPRNPDAAGLGSRFQRGAR